MQKFIQDLANELQTMHPVGAWFIVVCLICFALVIGYLILRVIQGVVENLHLVFAGMLIALIIFGGGYVIFFTDTFKVPQVVPRSQPTQVSNPENPPQPTDQTQAGQPENPEGQPTTTAPADQAPTEAPLPTYDPGAGQGTELQPLPGDAPPYSTLGWAEYSPSTGVAPRDGCPSITLDASRFQLAQQIRTVVVYADGVEISRYTLAFSDPTPQLLSLEPGCWLYIGQAVDRPGQAGVPPIIYQWASHNSG